MLPRLHGGSACRHQSRRQQCVHDAAQALLVRGAVVQHRLRVHAPRPAPAATAFVGSGPQRMPSLCLIDIVEHGT